MSELGMFLIAQSIVILMALVAAYVGVKVELTKLKVEVGVLQNQHGSLWTKVDGISRGLAEVNGRLTKSGRTQGD